MALPFEWIVIALPSTLTFQDVCFEFCCGLLWLNIDCFINIHQGCFIVTGANKTCHNKPEGILHGPLARYVKLRDAHAPGMPGTFSPPPRVSDSDIHHGTRVTYVPWCMTGSLTSVFLWSQWREKRSRYCVYATRNFTYLIRGPWGVPYS